MYVSMTYECVVPFLKGLHLTADAWRPGRNREGWKKRKFGTSPPVLPSSAPIPDELHSYLESVADEPGEDDVEDEY